MHSTAGIGVGGDVDSGAAVEACATSSSSLATSSCKTPKGRQAQQGGQAQERAKRKSWWYAGFFECVDEFQQEGLFRTNLVDSDGLG